MTSSHPHPEVSVQPKLTKPVHRRHAVIQRLTVLYVASLSAIAGLSMAGQFLIHRSLNRQTLDVKMIQAALEHKQQMGSAIDELRTLRRTHERDERQTAIAELVMTLGQVETSWDTFRAVANESSQSDPMMGMFRGLKPSYQRTIQRLNQALEQERQDQEASQKTSGSRTHTAHKAQKRQSAGELPAQGPKSRLAPLQKLKYEYMQKIDDELEYYNTAAANHISQLKRLELFLFVLTLTVLILEGVLVFRPAVRQTRKALSALSEEQEKSEKLLLNILPQPIAQRLKQAHQPIADAFDDVTVLFADIVGFTELSTQMPPQTLVKLLNQIFSAFDALVEQHNLEKIKTIGDAYMVVGGLPQPRADHAEAVVALALEMQAEIARFNSEMGYQLSIRIGINSGPVVAGVIGKKKFIYDLWGDTVNVASRMESHGQPGLIQVSESTAALIGDRYPVQSRGTIQVKGKGETLTYWVGRTGIIGALGDEALGDEALGETANASTVVVSASKLAIAS